MVGPYPSTWKKQSKNTKARHFGKYVLTGNTFHHDHQNMNLVMGKLINTSVDDLRSTLKCSLKYYTTEQLQKEIEDENKKDSPRSSVIKLLESAIKAKQK